jgi:hypothetical protein
LLKKSKYNYLHAFCLRSPTLPVTFIESITKNSAIKTDKLISSFNIPIISEAIFLASPELYRQIGLWLNDEIKDKVKIERLQYSLLKYLIRMSTRCTPFGLFAGCAVGQFGDKTSITLGSHLNNKIVTRLDMQFLVSLSQHLENQSGIKEVLKWHPNSSVYEIGDYYRYIEYSYIEGKREHTIEAIKQTPFIKKVLKEALTGKTISAIAKVIATAEISNEDATGFINRLIKNKLLVSELEPALTGDDFFKQICSVIERTSVEFSKLSVLRQIEGMLNSTYEVSGNNVEKFNELFIHAKSLFPEVNKKHLIQTDLFTSLTRNTIDVKWVNNIKKSLGLLNRLNFYQENINISSFKTSFLERYENQEIPLTEVLDTEMGIGYLNRVNTGNHSFIEDFNIPSKKAKNSSFSWSIVDEILNRKLQESQRNDHTTVNLLDSDFTKLNENWDDLTDTFAVMVELLVVKGKEFIFLNSAHGPTGAKLLARFCHGSAELTNLVTKIVEKEEENNANKILAEIIHLPEDRVGNVIQRPAIRNYEIPYLGKSSMDVNFQIPISDLLVSVSNGRIILKSKKHNKEVVPYLTNAHNFSFNSTPIYQFLCEIGSQDKRSGLKFSWGALENIYEYLPRVTYKGAILSKARWKIFQDSILPLINEVKDLSIFEQRKTEWIHKFNLPQMVQLVDRDNTLAINLKNNTCVKMLFETVKRRKSFILEEFLFADDSPVKDENGNHYSNQFIIPFYKEPQF